jgi:glycosyltransferase involved in cell wall biosynthesis
LSRVAPALEITVLLDRHLPDPSSQLPPAVGIARAGGVGGLPAWEQVYAPRAARGFDLVHCPANGAPLRPTCPVVLTLHDAIFMRPFGDISNNPYFRQYLGHLYRTRIYPRGARMAREVITVSESARAEIAALMGVPAERMTVISEAVPESFANCVPAPENGVRKTFGLEGRYLLAMGAFEKRKNINMLFRVMEWLESRAVISPLLALAGAENLAASGYAREVRARGIAHLVRFLPYVSDAELKALYLGATAFLMPSKREGFGLPLLEAMLCGIPVIASDIPPHREVAGDAAILVAPEDEMGWRTAAARILDDESVRRDLAARGSIRAAEFSWDKSAEMTLKVYDRAAAVR